MEGGCSNYNNFSLDFPCMGWKWTLVDPLPIHIYHSILKEKNYFDNFDCIYHLVMIPLYWAIFNSIILGMSLEAMDCLLKVGDYFVEEIFTYIRVWWSNGCLNVLPHYVLDKLLSREISYKTVGTGITLELKKSSKKFSPKFPLQVCLFTLQNYQQAERRSWP